MSEYIYKGDRLTTDLYKGRECTAVRRPDGKCIRGRNGNMLVAFGREKRVVPGRQLRKIIRNLPAGRQVRNEEIRVGILSAPVRLKIYYGEGYNKTGAIAGCNSSVEG